MASTSPSTSKLTSDFLFVGGTVIFSGSTSSGGIDTFDKLVAFSAESVMEREFINHRRYRSSRH